MANKLTVEEVQERFIRWGEAGVQDATLRKEFANVPSEDLGAILEAGMQGDDHWLRQENDQWFLVDFAGMSLTCALRIARALILNKLLPGSQKPKMEDLDGFTAEDLWLFVDRAEFAITCLSDALQDPNHEANRPYRELKKRFDALEANNAKLLQEKQQAVTDLTAANGTIKRLEGEVGRLKNELEMKPIPADAAIVSQEDLEALGKAKALVAIRPDLTPELLKQILGENTGLKQEAEAAKDEVKKAKKKAKKAAAARSKWRKVFVVLAVVALIVVAVMVMNGKGISLPSFGDGDSGLKDQLEQLK